jgi:hypothetical protein
VCGRLSQEFLVSIFSFDICQSLIGCFILKVKDAPLYATKALGGRGDIASTHSRPRH